MPVPPGRFEGHQIGEPAAPGQQRRGFALLHDLSTGEDDHVVGLAGGGESMCDGEHGRAGREDVVVQRGTEGGIAGAVYDRGGLIEEQHGRSGDEGPGEREELALAGGELDAAAPTAVREHGVVSVRQGADERVGAGCAGGELNLLGRQSGVAESDVVGDRAAEQRGILRDEASRARRRSSSSAAGLVPATARSTGG